MIIVGVFVIAEGVKGMKTQVWKNLLILCGFFVPNTVLAGGADVFIQ